uniref:DUF4221 family protein n=1 Tax=Roseivirga sp. TaxID=1964215 RepID=UPI0040478173
MTLFLILSIFSCNNQPKIPLDNAPQYKVDILPTDRILKISIDSTTSNVSEYLTYYYNDSKNEEYLISANTFMNVLQFFDLNEPQDSFLLPIEMNGTRGIGPILAAYVINLDSIIAFPTEDNNIYVLDTSYQKFKKIDYTEPSGYTNARPSMLYFSSYAYLKGNKVFVKSLYQTNFRTISNSQLSKIHLGYSIDLTSGNVSLLNHMYPDDYFKEGMKHYDFSASFSDNAFVYSFFGDHSLYVSKNPNEKIHKIYGKSKYLNEILPLFPADGDRLDRSKYLSIMDHYGNLIYDRYRAIYYRFCYPALEMDEMKDVLDNLHNPRQFSIQIFDKDLNIVGETLFENYCRPTKNPRY